MGHEKSRLFFLLCLGHVGRSIALTLGLTTVLGLVACITAIQTCFVAAGLTLAVGAVCLAASAATTLVLLWMKLMLPGLLAGEPLLGVGKLAEMATGSLGGTSSQSFTA